MTARRKEIVRLRYTGTESQISAWSFLMRAPWSGRREDSLNSLFAQQLGQFGDTRRDR